MARSDPHNSSRYWQVPDVPGMSLLHADFTAHDYAPHVHEAFVVAVTEIGGSEFKSRGKLGAARVGALLVFNPAEPHSGRMGGSTRWRYRSFYLAESGISDVLQLLGTDQVRYFTSNVFHDQDLVSRFLNFTVCSMNSAMTRRRMLSWSRNCWSAASAHCSNGMGKRSSAYRGCLWKDRSCHRYWN